MLALKDSNGSMRPGFSVFVKSGGWISFLYVGERVSKSRYARAEQSIEHLLTYEMVQMAV